MIQGDLQLPSCTQLPEVIQGDLQLPSCTQLPLWWIRNTPFMDCETIGCSPNGTEPIGSCVWEIADLYKPIVL